MSGQRHIIRKTGFRRPAGLETQFWPVSAALVVTAALAIVASLTTLEGNARWWSLVLVPAGLWVAAWGLQRVGNRWLRRSLQLAVLCSLALHLLMVILVSLTDVFGAFSPLPSRPLASPRPARILLASRAVPEPIWEKVNRREVEDPKLESSRVAASTETNPAPVDLAKPEERAETQIARRDTQRTESTPRSDASLSQRRRSEVGSTPASAAAASLPSTRPAENPAAAAASDSTAQPRRSVQPESEAGPAAAAASPALPRPGVSKASEVSRRRSETRIPELQPAESSSRAAVRSRNERLPVANPTPAPAAASNSPTTATPQPESPTAGESVQRPSRPVEAAQPSAELFPAARPVAESSSRRAETPAARPSIADPSAAVANPRRSRVQAPQTTTVAAAETPSLAAQASAQSGAQPQPSPTSLTRAESTGALANSSGGFAARSDPSAGAAPTASNAERRSEPASIASELQLLQNQASSRSRELARPSTDSSRALAVNTDAAALLAGARRTEDTSQTAPQAQTTSASRDPRMEVAAQPGETSVDTRPVKRTGESPLRADSGGGRPEIDATEMADGNTSRTRGSSQPSQLDAAVAATTGAVRTPSPRDSSSGTEPNATETPAVRASDAGESSSAPSLADSAPSAANRQSGRNEMPERQGENREQGRGEVLGDPSSEEDDEEKQQRLANRSSPRSQAADTAAEVSSGSSGEELPGTSELLSDSDAGSDATIGRRDPGRAGLDSPSPGFALSATDRQGLQSHAAGTAPGVERADSRVVDSGSSPTVDSRSRNSRGTPSRAAPAEIARGAGSSGSNPQAAPEAATTSERTGESMTLEIDAAIGAAGLGDTPSPGLGTPIRPGNRESQSIQFEPGPRFVREATSVSSPAAEAAAPLARLAFQSRQPSSSASSPSTEAAIELGLEFLARHQQPDGSWSLEMFDTGHPSHQQQLVSSSAATGLAVLAFQGAGYHHRDFRYALVLSRALTWLVEHQQEDGNLYVPSDSESNRYAMMYSHGIAALALTEAWGMTQDPSLRAPCERAIDFIASSQDPQRGGWRYRNEPGQRMTDTSVTGWMMMALHSARQGGLEVPANTLAGIESWMEVAHDPANPSLFRYDPYAENTASIQRVQQRNASPAMTAVGLLMRIYSGTDRESLLVQRGADYLLERPPGIRDGLVRDTYYWYYATQVLRHVGGTKWEQWNSRLHPLLVGSQEQSGPLAGSWDPYAPVPDRWGPFAGRLYVTTMNLLSLEVDYRLLPLYEKNTGRSP